MEKFIPVVVIKELSETDVPDEEEDLAEDPGGVVIENFDDDKDSDDNE